MRTVADLSERLQALHRRTEETPLFNPVFQLSLDLSRLLEHGELTLDDCASLIAELECDALKSRAERLRRLVAPVALAANAEALDADLAAPDFDAFRQRWEHPQLHAVFTAHPTFLLTPPQSAAIAAAASSDEAIDAGVCAVPAERPTITLAHEHEQAMRAMARAQDARDAIVARLLAHARRAWPDQWTAFAPLPFRFASWVGYDMDGAPTSAGRSRSASAWPRRPSGWRVTSQRSRRSTARTRCSASCAPRPAMPRRGQRTLPPTCPTRRPCRSQRTA
jgi:phosphoenolpyruvate carboxylase